MPTIKLTIDGKAYDMPIPNGFKLREQSPDCKAKGHICSKLDGNLVCTKLILKKDEHGNFEYFSLEPCSKNKSKKIMEI